MQVDGWKEVELFLDQKKLPIKAYQATSSQARRTGLLEVESVPDNFALWLQPAYLIHMFAMKSELDLVFINRQGKIVSSKQAKLNRMYGHWRGRACVEMSPGAIDKYKLRPGRSLTFE